MAPSVKTLSPGTEEVLSQTEYTRVVRRHSPVGPSLIIKSARGTHAIRRLSHEASVLERLADVEGVPRLAPMGADSVGSIGMYDQGGMPLASLLQRERLDIPTVLRFAVELVRIIASVHRRGVIHKDINPRNVLVVGPLRRPLLIDFNIASNFSAETPNFVHQREIVGTLAYMAPEQTGRMGRSLDQRADLYSVGVLLYEMAVGERPFDSEDLLELVHAHLVRVPEAPALKAPAVPPILSDLIMRLLEKEPECRYQSADGLAHDLLRMSNAASRGNLTPFPLAEGDFAWRLTAPARLIGREVEIATLSEAIGRSLDASVSCLLVTGKPGVGKTALINQLRPMITAQRGWFVCGKFDRYRQDTPTATAEALRALGRLLLAEPEDRLTAHRERIARILGGNVGFGPALLPEFRLLLGHPPILEVSDPRQAEARMIQATLDLLRGIASPEQPVVMVLDDMQWAPPVSMSFLDAIVTSADRIAGLLVVAVYRSDEVDASHPLTVRAARWRELGLSPPAVPLHNLPAADAAILLEVMLRMPAVEAARLAKSLHEHSDGNPYDTIELVNALRQEGLLTPCEGRWHWEPDAIRRHLGVAHVVDLLVRRITRLPAATVDLLELLACLGGEACPQALAVCGDLDIDILFRQIEPALEDGLLVVGQNSNIMLSFRHDRVQQAVFERFEPAELRLRRLKLARHLCERTEFSSTAAEQYLHVVDAVVDEGERRRVITLFREAAKRLRTPNLNLAERYLRSSIDLLREMYGDADNQVVAELQVEHHVALYGLGRHDEADALYASIVARHTEPMDLVGPTGVQMFALAHRGRFTEALELGLRLLRELGLAVPVDFRPDIVAGFKRLADWNRGDQPKMDFTRPLASDERILAWGELISKSSTTAFFCNSTAFAWLTTESLRLWIEQGPCAPLACTVNSVSLLLAGSPQDYRGAATVGRHFVQVCEVLELEPSTSIVRCVQAVGSQHWLDPIENVIASARQARADLVRMGEFTFAGYTYVTFDLLFDSAATLETSAAEVEAGMAFSARMGHHSYYQRSLPRRQLIRALRGETQAPGSLDDAHFNGADYAQGTRDSGGLSTYHVARVLSAALFGDTTALAQHIGAAVQSLPSMPGLYVTALVHTMQGVVLAERARSAAPPERTAVLDLLDSTSLRWLALRAADAPANFLHLLRWVQAERAWAGDSIWAAGAAFDIAMQEAARGLRPWHLALITERAALFHLAHGMDATGQPLVARAYALYEDWGATGKTREMRRQHVFLRSESGLLRGYAGSTVTRRTHSELERSRPRTTDVSADVIDMLAVLRASQLLSSETSLPRLTASVAKVLSALTGATGVHLLVRPDANGRWYTAASLGEGSQPVTAEQAGTNGDLSISAFRYAERTREVLLIDDAARDDRFAFDPYFAPFNQCSMLLAPILAQGELRAILVLENRMHRRSFSADRLDAVVLIAGQLAVSLDNALLYASLERKVAERTEALEQVNQRLERLAVTDVLTGLANRRRLNEVLDAEWKRSLRKGTSIGIALIDVDQFKLYNDHYGHLQGDECLRRVANCLVAGLRALVDLAARYGGEEFVLVLPETDLPGTHAVAERTRARVAALCEPHAVSIHGVVTISIGIAAFVPTDDATTAEWLKAADAALYEAKQQGRNRVCDGSGA